MPGLADHLDRLDPGSNMGYVFAAGSACGEAEQEIDQGDEGEMRNYIPFKNKYCEKNVAFVLGFGIACGLCGYGT